MAWKLFSVAALWLVVLAGVPPAAADDTFADGLAAYDAGDYVLSFATWHTLAAGGHVDAQAALAGLYAQGFGVIRDPAEAANWYRRAAEQGHVVAQINIAERLAAGRGIARDPVLAYAWYSLAADAGHVWPRQRLAELGRELAPEQIASARRAARCALQTWHGHDLAADDHQELGAGPQPDLADRHNMVRRRAFQIRVGGETVLCLGHAHGEMPVTRSL